MIRGETHDAMDLDVGLPLTGMNPTQGMAELTKQALQAGLKFVRNQATTDSRLCKAFFQTADGTTDFEVQVRHAAKLFEMNVWKYSLILRTAIDTE